MSFFAASHSSSGHSRLSKQALLASCEKEAEHDDDDDEKGGCGENEEGDDDDEKEDVEGRFER